jgi:predicted transposase/invertase (TIGR01784 family)
MAGLTGKKERVLISFDYALKRLLRNKVNYDVLEGFLSELLMRDVKVIKIGESESNKQHAKDKYNRVDVLVEDENKETIIIELQFTLEIDYFHRMLYGASKVVGEYMLQGDQYLEIRKVYSINIVYFDLGQGEDYVYHGRTQFRGLHLHDELKLSEVQRAAFSKDEVGDIYPEYYILKVNKFNDVAKDALDEWVYFLKHNTIKDEFKGKGLAKAKEVLDRDKLSPEEKAEYDYLERLRSEDLSAMASSNATGRFEARKEFEGIIAEKETLLAEKEAVIARERADKEAAIAENARERAEKETLLAEKAALEKQVAELKSRTTPKTDK